MNKIMELADAYALAKYSYAHVPSMVSKPRDALAAEVQAHIDYTSVVIAERDALKDSARVFKSLLVERTAERDALCKVAQMALDAYDHHYADDLESKVAFEALRKELGL